MKNKLLFSFILFFYAILPIVILCNSILFKYKFYILTIVGLFIFSILKLNNVSNKDLGILKKNSIISLKRNIPIIFSFILLIIIFKFLKFNKYTQSESIYFYIFYIFVSCPLQEFLYRGIFGFFDRTLIKNKTATLILSSFCYSFVHIIYRDLFICVLTFIFGIVLYSLYRKDYNLFGVCVNHIVLGILTIYFGIVN